MGVVFLARRQSTEELVAIKILLPDESGTQPNLPLFLREVSMLGQLDHPRIVSFREVGIDEGRMFLVMQYVPHLPFEEWVKKFPHKQLRLACGAVCQALDALDHAHCQGVVHRDVKPENLLLSSVNGRLEVRVVDFGLAKKYQDAGLSGLTDERQVRGSLGYMAPEQVRSTRTAGPPADIYSAGATLYRYLSGKLPYDFLAGQHPLTTVLQSAPIPLSQRRNDLPEQLVKIVNQALSRHPEDRFSTAEEFANALRPFTKKA